MATHECVAEHVHDVQGWPRPHGAAPPVSLRRPQLTSLESARALFLNAILALYYVVVRSPQIGVPYHFRIMYTCLHDSAARIRAHDHLTTENQAREKKGDRMTMSQPLFYNHAMLFERASSYKAKKRSTSFLGRRKSC